MAKSKSKTFFVCQNCGSQRPKWEGRCSECGAWNSLVEEVESSGTRSWSVGQSPDKGPGINTLTLDQSVEPQSNLRVNSNIGELNRVLGGGLVPGSFILLGGDPGIGKSTLLLQMANGVALDNKKVLYVSAEESLSQTGLRSHRLGLKSKNVEIASESDLEKIIKYANEKKPDVLVVDSIQTVYLPSLESAPGTVTQVRESASQLMGLAKNCNICVWLIGHITKDGSIAGPKVLEHMVDTVLSFEGDMSLQFRLLRALKNRFGPTHELGVFQMEHKGLVEVSNPSELFLQERNEQLMGSAVFAAMEGTRPVLCELQSLTSYSPTAVPRRTAIGCDINRLHLLIAVLGKHLDVNLSQNEVYLNVVGGLKIIEPAADLAIVASILSSKSGNPLPKRSCFVGEVGLTGEVRGVSFLENRFHEAYKLGFESFYAPKANEARTTDLSKDIQSRIKWIESVDELSRLIVQEPGPNGINLR